ncbi:MAG: twin-arginine translocase subunit TatC [Hyphomicrobium sp.]
MQERLTSADPALDGPNRDGQDDIDASKAPLMDHLIELRSRLMWAIGAFIVMFFVCFAVAGHIYNVLVWPYMWASGNDHVRLIATHFLEQIMTQVKLAMFGAAFLSFPVIATQIYKFVAPGLYKNERRAFLPYLVATPVLFVIGAAVVYFIAMPVLIKFSIGLTQTTGDGVPTIELLPKVSEYLSLIMTLIFGFGIVFQLPVVLTLLARTGFVTSQGLSDGRRYAIVAIFAAAAVLTPPDALSMIIMALPTVLLYEASIFAVRFVEKKPMAPVPAEG